MARTSSPTARRRQLGSLLRTRRLALGMTVDEVAKHLLVSPSKISRAETGQRSVSARDIRDLAELYRLSAEERDLLDELAAGGKERAWWQPFNLPYSYATYVGLEADATSIRDFALGVLPGLLQTERYAEAVARAMRPSIPAESLSQLVQARLERQRRVLRETRTNFTALLDEGTLRRVVGGEEVMREQARALLTAAELPNVAIRLVPFDAGPLPAPTNKFILLAFDGLPDVVFLETMTGQLFLERDNELRAYQDAFLILEGLALTADETRDRILAFE